MKTTIAILITFFLGFANNLSAQSYEYLQNGYYGHGYISSSNNSYWKYRIPANSMGVFTLKNPTNNSDLDIYIYNDSGRNYRLNYGNEPGSKTELVTVYNNSDYGKYVYIKIANAGDYRTKFQFYGHAVNLTEKAGEAIINAGVSHLATNLLCWLADADCDSGTNSRNAGRAANVAVSLLKGEDFGSMTKGAIRNELTTELRNQLGYGFWGDFALNYTIDILDDVYRNYW